MPSRRRPPPPAPAHSDDVAERVKALAARLLAAERIGCLFIDLDQWLAVLPPPPLVYQSGDPLSTEFGTPLHYMGSVEAAFDHFIGPVLKDDETSQRDRRTAMRVFTYAVQTAIAGSPADWERLRLFESKIDSLVIRRTQAIGLVERAIASFHETATDSHVAEAVNALFVTLRFADRAFMHLTPEAIHRALQDAKPGKHKGGAGNRGAIRVTAEFAISVGALGFDRFVDTGSGEAFAAARRAAIKALQTSSQEADKTER